MGSLDPDERETPMNIMRARLKLGSPYDDNSVSRWILRIAALAGGMLMGYMIILLMEAVRF